MSEAFKFWDYIALIGQGDITRSEAARLMGVSKTTARYHLEKAVSQGELERVKLVIDDRQVGFVYRKPGVNQELPFHHDEEETPDLLDQLFEDGTSALDLDTWIETGTGEEFEEVYDHQGLYSHTTVRDARWEID